MCGADFAEALIALSIFRLSNIAASSAFGWRIIRSTTPRLNKSCAVILSASAASGALELSFHRMDAQPSGEMTE